MKPYSGRRLRKIKGGYEAAVYVLARATGKTKVKARNALNRIVWEMECNSKGCCQPAVFTASTGNTANFLIQTKA